MNKDITLTSRLRLALESELCRRNFWEFCLFMDKDFFEKRAFLKEVADALMRVFIEYKAGRAIKIAISMPPRAGKSYIVSLFCAWWLGKFPEESIMRNTCTSRLFSKFSYDVRAIIKSNKYRQAFPLVMLSPDKQNLDGWNITKSKQVAYFGAGVGGTVIGFGANLAITDDLYKDIIDALSQQVQENVTMWKQSAHDSRMEKNCPEIYIGTRWTKNDEIGKAIESGKIDVAIKISALTKENKSFCENVKSTQEYLKIKGDIDESIWDAEYMQDPVELKGLLFPKSELKFADMSQINFNQISDEGVPLVDYKFAYVDPADTGGDMLSAPFAYLIGDKIYIRSVLFNNDGTDVTIPELVERICTQKIDTAYVEGNSAWVLFGKELRSKVNDDPSDGGRGYDDCDITIIKNTTNKQTRIIAESAFIKNHIYFDSNYEKDAQYKLFISKLIKYMRDGSFKEDDAPDSLVGVANYFRNQFAHLF